MVETKYLFDFGRRGVASANPDHLWRTSEQKALLAKVSIFGHDRETVLCRVLPDGIIICRFKSHILNV